MEGSKISPNKLVYIYHLTDPRDSWRVRYVGQTTKSLVERLKSHVKDSRRLRNHKENWVNSLTLSGVAPKITLIQETIFSNMKEMESFWISFYRSAGHNLTNSTNGGDGQSPGWVPSEITRLKMSISHRGKEHSQESREKSRKSNLGQKRSAETKKNISMAALGKKRKPFSEEHRKKIGDAHRGKKISEDQKQKLSLLRKGTKLSAEHRKKISRGLTNFYSGLPQETVPCAQ